MTQLDTAPHTDLQRGDGSMRTTTVAMKLEVVVLPVSDVDRARRFYETMGFRLDADYANR
jgi:bleomycin resistance family protein